MIKSNLEFYGSTVLFTEGFSDGLPLERVDTGFFILFLGSTLKMGQNTTIKNLKAQNQAVISAFSLSNVYFEGGVSLFNNKAMDQAG